MSFRRELLKVGIGPVLANCLVGNVIQNAAVVGNQVGKEPIGTGAARELVQIIIVEYGLAQTVIADKKVNAIVTANKGTRVEAAAPRSIRQIIDPLGIAARRVPFGHENLQNRIVRVICSHAGNQQIISGIADQAIGTGATDEKIPSATAIALIVTRAAQNDIWAIAAVEVVVAVTSIDQCRQADSTRNRHFIVAVACNDDDVGDSRDRHISEVARGQEVGVHFEVRARLVDGDVVVALGTNHVKRVADHAHSGDNRRRRQRVRAGIIVGDGNRNCVDTSRRVDMATTDVRTRNRAGRSGRVAPVDDDQMRILCSNV